MTSGHKRAYRLRRRAAGLCSRDGCPNRPADGTRLCGDCRLRQAATRHPEKAIWSGIRHRCQNRRSTVWDYYGGRGIGVCRRWDESFAAFLADLGPRPSLAHSVDRADANGGYWCGRPACPECGPLGRVPNCRWATRAEQASNTRATITVAFGGRTQPLAAWAAETGIPNAVLSGRLRAGMDPARALTLPHRPRGSGKTRRTLRGQTRHVWRGMVNRCHRPDCREYGRYGAAGVAVCVRWREDFFAFLADMGVRPHESLTVDRVDNAGGYWCGAAACAECGPAGRTPNCRWATASEQNANRRLSRKIVRTVPRHLAASAADAYMPTGPAVKTRHPGEYASWAQMKQRCLNPKAQHYHRFGGRGVVVCERWLSFANFIADMGPRPAGARLGRISEDAGFSPANCVWTQGSKEGGRGRPPRAVKST